MQQRLSDIGDWLKINGEAIYGTRPWHNKKANLKNTDQSIFYTTKKQDLYVICTKWPRQDVQVPEIQVPEIQVPDNQVPDIRVSDVQINANISVRLLGFEKLIKWEAKDGRIVITPPLISAAEVPCQHAYVFKISNALTN